MCGIFQGKCLPTSYCHGHVLLAFYVEDIDGIRILFKLQYYARYHTILYYITVHYFFFCVWFFVFLYHTHTQYVGENACYDIGY
jgi:hypothetical protein